MSSEQRLIAELSAAGIAFTIHEHEAVFTVEESAGLHATIAGRFWLVTMPHDRRADLKYIDGRGETAVRQARSTAQAAGGHAGAVTPLGAMNDIGGEVTVVLDAAFNAAGTINVHPLRNNALARFASGSSTT